MPIAFLHSPAQIIQQVLIDLAEGTDPVPWEDQEAAIALGAAAAWPVFSVGEPALPDNVITIYDTSPQFDGSAMHNGETWFHYGFQVRIRSALHQSGFVKMNDINKALDEDVYNLVVTLTEPSQQYLIQSISGTMPLVVGKETPASKRDLFTINALATIRRM